MKCVFNIVVWGEDYVRQFLDWSFPTLLAPGNFDGFPFLGGAQFMLMTTKADWEGMRKGPQIRQLERLMEVVPVFIDAIIPSPTRPAYNHKYIRVSLAQSECMRRVGGDADAIFFLYPDFLYSTGALSHVAARMDEGYQAVCCPIPTILQDDIENGLYDQQRLVVGTKDGPIVTIPPRRLVELSCLHPHPMSRGFDMSGKEMTQWPGYFMWPVAGEGWLIHSFHLHPMAIRPRPSDPDYFKPFELSLDDEYASRSLAVGDNIYFPACSDEVALCSFRPAAMPPHPQPGRRGAVLPAVRWAEQYASLTHRWFLTKPYRWQHASASEQAWQHAEAQAREFVSAVRERLTVPDMVLAYEDHLTYEARQRRKLHYAQIDT